MPEKTSATPDNSPVKAPANAVSSPPARRPESKERMPQTMNLPLKPLYTSGLPRPL